MSLPEKPPHHPATSKQDSAAAELGAVERFIELFHGYEVQAGLFEQCVDGRGFAWWDVARYWVQMAICTQLGIVGRRAAVRRPAFDRVVGMAHQLVGVASDLPTIVEVGRVPVQAIFVYGRPVDSLIAAGQDVDGPRLIVANDDRALRAGDVLIAKRSVDLFVKVAARLTRVPGEVVAFADQIDASLKQLFGVDLDIRSIILDRYRHHVAASSLWGRVLARTPGVMLLGYVNDDTLKTLVALAGARGIATREFQHGYMGRSNVAFAYPTVQQRIVTIPDEVVVEWDSGDISYPAHIVPTAQLGLESTAARADVVRDIDVLVGGSPTRNSDAVAIAGALTDRGLSLTVKLHPAQTEESTGLRPRFSSDQVTIAAGADDFRVLAARAKVFVPANPTSSTAFQAVELGAKLVVVDYDGVKLTSVIDHLVSARVASVDQLPKVISDLLPGNGPGGRAPEDPL